MKKNWTIKVFFITFILACIFTLLSNLLGDLNNYMLVLSILIVLTVGIIFDVIGTASLSCDIRVLHSKASQKIKGSREAVNLAKNSSLVSSFCNDVVGDICGIVSGSLIAFLVTNLFINNNLNLYNILMTALLSSLTVGGKALGKTYAIKKSNDIIFAVGKILSLFKKNA